MKTTLRSAILPLLVLCLTCSCSVESTDRKDKPVTRADVATLGFTLPADADECYYLNHAGGLQDLEQFVRFHVPSSSLEDAVKTLIDEHDRVMKMTYSHSKQTLTSVPTINPRAEFLPMPWWDTKKIKSGYYLGSDEGYGMRFWIDQDRRLVFFYIKD